jgi:hypothetical protein
VKEPKHPVLNPNPNPTPNPNRARNETYLATGSSQLQGIATPRLRSPGGPPSSKDRDIPSSSGSRISTVPSRSGQLATSGPLDDGALTYRRAHSPVRRPAAAPSLSVAVTRRKKERPKGSGRNDSRV